MLCPTSSVCWCLGSALSTPTMASRLYWRTSMRSSSWREEHGLRWSSPHTLCSLYIQKMKHRQSIPHCLQISFFLFVFLVVQHVPVVNAQSPWPTPENICSLGKTDYLCKEKNWRPSSRLWSFKPSGLHWLFHWRNGKGELNHSNKCLGCI